MIQPTTSVINEVLEAVIGMINETGPFANITRGALPTGNGLSCEIGPSTVQNVYLDKNMYYPLDVTLNGKHDNLKTLSDTLSNIHSVLTRKKSYPSDTANGRWYITDITTLNLPSIIDREENNMWMMASALSVKFYQRGD